MWESVYGWRIARSRRSLKCTGTEHLYPLPTYPLWQMHLGSRESKRTRHKCPGKAPSKRRPKQNMTDKIPGKRRDRYETLPAFYILTGRIFFSYFYSITILLLAEYETRPLRSSSFETLLVASEVAKVSFSFAQYSLF